MKTLFSLPTFLKIFFFTLVWLTFCFTCVLRSTLHRVLVNGQERYSVRPLFYLSPFFLSENCCKTLISFWWPLLLVSVSAISSYKGSTLFSICFLFYLLLAAGMFFLQGAELWYKWPFTVLLFENLATWTYFLIFSPISGRISCGSFNCVTNGHVEYYCLNL